MAIPDTTQFFPRSRSYDLQAGLAARVYDPAWLLLRQWQMGEFRGEDAGSTVQAVVESTTCAVTRIVTPERAYFYDPADMPLETLVERESRHSAGPDLRTRSQWGLLFLEYLEKAGLGYNRRKLLELFGYSAASRESLRNEPSTAQVLMRHTPDSNEMYRVFVRREFEDTLLATFFPMRTPLITAPIVR